MMLSSARSVNGVRAMTSSTVRWFGALPVVATAMHTSRSVTTPTTLRVPGATTGTTPRLGLVVRTTLKPDDFEGGQNNPQAR